MEAKVYVPSDEEFRENGILSLMEVARKELNADDEKLPIFKIRSPQWFRDFFVVNNSTLPFSKFKLKKVRETSFHVVTDGIVAMKLGNKSFSLQRNHFDGVINTIAEVQHNVTNSNYRRFFSSESLLKKAPTKYMENFTGSFMDNVYKVNTRQLPMGYSLNSLNGVLNTIIPTRIPGVTRSMLYIAERGTMAPIHIEDIAMMSINYHIAGYPKAWMGVHPDDMHFVNKIIREHYRSDCITPLLHRDIVIPVEFLESRNVRFVYTVQQPGEFVVTLPMGWHQVANDGCNLSEAVNVYCDGWPVIAGRQNYCNCHDRGTTYNSDEWDPVINWLQYGEQQMMAELADERFDVESLEIPDKVGDLLVEYRAQSLERTIEPHRYDKRANNQISRKSASRRSPKTSFRINDLLESDLSCDRYEKLFDRAKITDDSNDKPTEVVNEVIKIAPTNPQEDSDVASVDENNVNSLQELSQNETNPFRDPQQFKQFINNYFRPDENKTNTRREKIDRIKKNKEIYKKSASSRKRFSAKRVKTRDNYERTPLAIYFRDKIKIAKRAIKNIDAKVADYHSIVDAPPYMLTRNNNEKRAQRVIEVDHLTKRRDLHNVLQKVWGREKVYNCFAKGHTELTVLRDYFNNNDATNVEYFKECMGLVPVTHKEFWESLLIDKAAWNDYFGVDDRYRIPWKIWTSLLPLKN